MTTVTIEEAQARLSQIIDSLRPGEELTITDHGTPLARVQKAQAAVAPQLRPAPGLGKGFITVVCDDNEHLQDFAEYMP